MSASGRILDEIRRQRRPMRFLGASGQLGVRDAVVNNLGSLLDPTQTGIVIPE